MVYDCPMTENQSVIEEIAMVNCGEEILKFFLDRPLISSLYGPPGLPGSVQQTNPDIYSSIHDPAIQSGRIPAKRLRIILRSGSVMQPSCSLLRTIANSMTRGVSRPGHRRSRIERDTAPASPAARDCHPRRLPHDLHCGQFSRAAASQSSTCSSETRSNSRVLCVTSTRRRARACPAINASYGPIGVPTAASCARISPAC